MSIFVNRVRCAYLQKRSTKSMALATVVFLAVVAVMGRVGRFDFEDKLADAARTHDLREQFIKADVNFPPFDSMCLAIASPRQHCQTQLQHE